MIRFKRENKGCHHNWNHLILVTKSGFMLIAEHYQTPDNTPKCFIVDNNSIAADKPKQSAAVPTPHRPTTDEYIIALNVLRYLNDFNKEQYAKTTIMKEYYRSDIESMDKAIKNIGVAISVG